MVLEVKMIIEHKKEIIKKAISSEAGWKILAETAQKENYISIIKAFKDIALEKYANDEKEEIDFF